MLVFKGGHHQIGIVKPFHYTEPNKPFVVLPTPAPSTTATNSTTPLNLACESATAFYSSSEPPTPLPPPLDDVKPQDNELSGESMYSACSCLQYSVFCLCAFPNKAVWEWAAPMLHSTSSAIVISNLVTLRPANYEYQHTFSNRCLNPFSETCSSEQPPSEAGVFQYHFNSEGTVLPASFVANKTGHPIMAAEVAEPHHHALDLTRSSTSDNLISAEDDCVLDLSVKCNVASSENKLQKIEGDKGMKTIFLSYSLSVVLVVLSTESFDFFRLRLCF